jgi:hypothetical protein
MPMIPELWTPQTRKALRSILRRDGRLSPEGWVVRRLTYPDGTIEIAEGPNIVTDAGDLWYAQKLALQGDTVTNDFAAGRIVLGTGAVAPSKTSTYTNLTPIAGSAKAQTAGYPKRNDSDTDNTGKATDSITWKGDWAAGDFNVASGIIEGCITIAAPAGGSPLLSHFQLSTFGKDSSTTLTLWVNHNVLGS